jgi:peroxiredoxin
MTVIAELFNDAKFIIKFRRKLMKRQMGLDQLAPKVDDLAPDFTLSDISGTESVTPSDFRGKKPVALVFGSYT